jgi:hypothetical protein
MEGGIPEQVRQRLCFKDGLVASRVSEQNGHGHLQKLIVRLQKIAYEFINENLTVVTDSRNVN